MKKMLTTLTAIALSIVMVSTVEAKRGQKVQRSRTASTAATADNMGTTQEIRENTKRVEEVVKQVQVDSTPEAKQEAADAVAELLASLHQRDWSGDLRGYTEEQIKTAGDKLELLNKELVNVDAEIKQKQTSIDALMDKGYLWNSVQKDKKEEHATLSGDLKTLKTRKSNIEKAIKNQTVIAGKSYASAIKGAVGAVTIAAAAGVALAVDAYKFDGKGRAYLTEKGAQAYAGAKSYLPAGLRGTPAEPAVQENVYGRTKRWLAEKAGTTAEKFPAGQTYDVPRVRTPRAPMTMERAADLSDM